MAKRISTAMRNFLADRGSWADALSGGRIKVYSGVQPATADDAPTGTLLATFTTAGATFVPEVRATATLTISGSAGSVSSVTVGGMELLSAAVDFTTDLTTTAGLIAAGINARRLAHRFTAAAVGATVTLTAPLNSGSAMNGMTVAATATTLAVSVNGGSSTTLGGTGATAGVDSSGGLGFLDAAAGVLKKDAGAWQGIGLADGSAGWMRFEGTDTDTGAPDTSFQFLRFDCSIGTTGADINVTNTTVAVGAGQTFGKFELTIPAAQ